MNNIETTEFVQKFYFTLEILCAKSMAISDDDDPHAHMYDYFSSPQSIDALGAFNNWCDNASNQTLGNVLGRTRIEIYNVSKMITRHLRGAITKNIKSWIPSLPKRSIT